MMSLMAIAVILIVAGAVLMLIAIAVSAAVPKRTRIQKSQPRSSQKKRGGSVEDEDLLVV